MYVKVKNEVRKLSSIAHIREKDGHIQTVEEHLREVKTLAEQFGEKIGVKYIAGLAGMLHDVGKYSNEFTNYIKKAVYDSENAPKRGSVDHATAGGRLIYLHFQHKKASIFEKLLAEIVGNVIISHHSYLHDFLSPEDISSPYLKRIYHKELNYFEQTKEKFFEKVISKRSFNVYIEKAVEELKVFLKNVKHDELEFQIMFLTKFIFSCLIDADRTNTRQFVEEENPMNLAEKDQKIDSLFTDYYEKLINRLKEFKDSSIADSEINKLRTEMSEQCDEFAKKSSNIYTLSIPTGGGKTLASFRYALKHAKQYQKERIIYVVPYTTIIEQNAEEVREIIRDDINVLEHHSNVILDDFNEEDMYTSAVRRQQMLAKDNWDVPIIFTTMVQFLNVFYAHGSSNIRRLHNLANSVIIFDEVQKVPTHCISLFNRALNFLSHKAKSSILLCTATQPALNYVEHQLNLPLEAEIVEDLPKIVHAFKRVEIVDKATGESYTNQKLTQFIEQQLEEKNSILVILNTKSVVRDLYKQIKNEKKNDVFLFHLSTSMCAAHRNDILEKMRKYLKEDYKVVCLSTQLIEAGVDISFDCVIRSLSGLDSIAQAAGRCNRHGEASIREVYVIDHEEENLSRLKEIEQGKEITKKLLVDLKHNPQAYDGYLLSPIALERYFQEFYEMLNHQLNYPLAKLDADMSFLLGGQKQNNSNYIAYEKKWNEKYPLVLANSYRTSAKHFQVIKDQTTSVLVPYKEGKEYIATFNSFERLDDLSTPLKQSQHYTVNLYDHELETLKANGHLHSLMEGMIFALDEGAYDDEYGVDLEGDVSLDLNIF